MNEVCTCHLSQLRCFSPGTLPAGSTQPTWWILGTVKGDSGIGGTGGSGAPPRVRPVRIPIVDTRLPRPVQTLQTGGFVNAFGNGLVLPFVLIFMLLLTNDRELMGDQVNSRSFNVIAWITVVVMIVLTLAMLVRR